MKYCTHCGKELLDEAVICVNCGCMVKIPVSAAPAGIADDRLLNKLAERVKINGIIWLVIATSIWNDFSVVVISYPLTWTLASLCYLVYYLKGGWLKKWETEHSS